MSITSRLRSAPRYARTLLSYYTQQETPLLSYWWRGSQKNVGDLMGPFLLAERSGRLVIHVDDAPLFEGRRDVFVSIGSVLQQMRFRRLKIWGTGIIDPSRVPDLKNPTVYSVRGPLTRKALLDQGYACPGNYGDPGLLIGRYTKATATTNISSTQCDVGLVLHHSDMAMASDLRDSEHVRLITVRSEVPEFVSRIRSCSIVLSSSLHGIITAHALGLPAVWLRRVENKKGGDFKYRDYLRSYGAEVKYADLKDAASIKWAVKNVEANTLPPPPETFIDQVEADAPV